MSETRKDRNFSAQKTEIVLASLGGPKTIAQLCRQHDISERTEVDELRGQVAKLERALRRKTMEVEIAGNSCGAGGARRAGTGVRWTNMTRSCSRSRARTSTPPMARG